MKIKPEKDFPDLHLCVTGSYGQELFRVASNHDHIYLPEQLVVHAEEYTQQQQIDNQHEVKIAKDFGLSVEEYRAQQEMLDQANRARDMVHEKRRDNMVLDLELRHEDEEQHLADIRAKGEKTEGSLYLVQTGHTIYSERTEQERQALEEFQRAQFHVSPDEVPREKLRRNFDKLPSYSPAKCSPDSSLPSQTIVSSDPPTRDPRQFAIGSMVSVPTQRGKDLYGVVMWIGTFPEIDGVIAGVELVSHIALIHYMLI